MRQKGGHNVSLSTLTLTDPSAVWNVATGNAPPAAGAPPVMTCSIMRTVCNPEAPARRLASM